MECAQLTIIIDKDAQINGEDGDEHTEERDRSELGDKTHTNEHENAHNDQEQRSVNANVVVQNVLVSFEIPEERDLR